MSRRLNVSMTGLDNYIDVYQAAFTHILKRSKDNSKEHGYVELDVDGAHALLGNFDFTQEVERFLTKENGSNGFVKTLLARVKSYVS